MTTELTWIPLSLRKNVTLPKVVIEESIGQNYGGYYIRETKCIVAVESEAIATTIAHEYKHHLQYTGGTLQEPTDWNKLSDIGYNKAIRSYFRNNRSEMEALIFQEKYAPSIVGRFWLKGLVLPNKFVEGLEM